MKKGTRLLYISASILLVFLMAFAIVSCGEETPSPNETQYTVTFDSAGGSAVAAQTVTAGSCATQPTAPTRDRYTFVSWLLNGEVYDFSAPVNGDITLTAGWRSTGPYTVKFVDPDGTVLKEEEVARDAAATAPEDPTRAGYAFTGWDRAYDKITSDLTVTAQYVRLWTVQFKGHDGTVLKTEEVRDGGAATAPAAPAREHYTFSGWDIAFSNVTDNLIVTATYTEVAKVTVTFMDYDGSLLGTAEVYPGEAAVAPIAPTHAHRVFNGWDKDFTNVMEDMTVTATYTEDEKFTVVFKDYDGTVIDTVTVYIGEAATAPASPSREHYTFSGWDKAFDNVTESITVTATYTENAKFTVTFKDHDGTVLDTVTVYVGEAATAPAVPARENYTFAGWDKAFTDITEDLEVTALYTENDKISVTFKDHDGSIIEIVTVYIGGAATAPAAPTREHYTFSGWDKAFDNVTESIVVTATYTEHEKFTVTFKDHDGTTLDIVTVYIGEAATAPAAPTREHYTFSGWDKAFDNVTESIIVTATYTEHEKFTVTFKDHDGTTLDTVTVYTSEAATAPTVPARENFTFTGWDKAFDNVTESIIVTATYTEHEKFTVIFKDHDDSTIDTITVYIGKAVAAISDPVRDGYAFTGWMFGGTLYDFTTPVTEDITLVASYTRGYTATYTDENGNVLKVVSVAVGETPVAPIAPYKAHHVFSSWVLSDGSFESGAVTYTPVYTLVKHVVTFNHANGTGDTTPITVDDCTAVTEQPAPAYDGFTFAYWMTDQGEIYDFSAPVIKDIVLTAKYEIATTIPAATESETVVYISPGYLEFYMGIELQLNIEAISNYTAANGKITSGSYDVNYAGFDYTFYTDRPDIITITEDGTITPVSLGTARVWARINQGGTQTTADTAYLGASYDDFTIADGTVLPAIEVNIIEKPAYLQLAEANPDTQKIQLGQDAEITIADFLGKPTGDYGSANIALWYNDATAVMTLTVDDNIVSDFNQWNAWYEEYGVPFTLFVISRSYDLYGNRWADMTAIGNEIQPHGQIHAAAQYYNSDYFTSAQAWHDSYTSKQVVEATTGNRALVFSYPCGYNADFNKILYIGGRAVGTLPVNAATVNYNTVHIPGIPSAEAFESLFDPTVNNKYYPYGGWLNALQHNIGDAKATYDAFLPLAKDRMDSGELWAALFSAACQYGQERDTARILNMNAGADIITFTLTDNMNDLLFDHALTIKIKVDDTWTGARAYQNGGECETRIVTEGGETYVYVNAVPDKGEVKVIRSATTVSVNDTNRIVFTPTGIAGMDGENSYTYTFTVDAAAWTHAYAVQNGSFIPATISTEGGKTTLSVTALVNGGEVTVVPVTDQYDARESLTMYEVWRGFITPDGTKPVLISSAEDLVMLSDYVRNHGANAGITFRMTTDIDMSSVENLLPIGWQTDPDSNGDQDACAPFSGIFDGDGHTIYNLTIYHSRLSYIGLFGYTKDATISRVNVIGSVEGLGRVGGVVGRMFGGTMNGVTFTGSVISRGDAHFGETGARVGGLIGQANSVTVTNCAAYASVTAYAVGKSGVYLNHPNGADCGSKVGGIVGELFYKHGVSDISTFNNIVFEGTVTAHAAPGDSGAVYVGGFSGYLIETNATNVTINANVTGRKIVGGFTGAMEHQNYRPSNIKNCSVNGSVTGDDYVAGFAGKIEVGNPLKLYNCYVAVEVNAPATAVNVGAVYGASPYGSDIGTTHNTTTKSIYFIASLNSAMAAHPGTIKDASTNCIEAADAEGALEGLNTYAAANGLTAWRMDEGIPSAAYFPIYTVTILDKDGNVLDTQAVGAGLNAVMPEMPLITGFEFDGWNKSYENISANVTIQAVYRAVETFTVTFLDKDGNVIETQIVNTGRGATAPTTSEYERLWLVGWDKSFDVITADTTVTAQYVDAYYVTFAYKTADGSDTTTCVKVPAGGTATPPSLPTSETLLFSGWSGSYENVTADVTVTATYRVIDLSPLSLNILQWTLTEAPSDAYYSYFTGSDIIAYAGTKDLSAYTLPDGWAMQVTTVAMDNGAQPARTAIIYNTAKYRFDDMAGIYCKSPLSGVTNGTCLAVPLIDLATNQQVVIVQLSLGYWAAFDAFGNNGKTAKIMKDILPSITAQFPNASGIVISAHTQTKNTNTGLCDTISASDDTTAYVDGYDMTALHEVDTDTYASYVITYMKEGMTATISNATTVDAADGISTNNGIRYTLTVAKEETGE